MPKEFVRIQDSFLDLDRFNKIFVPLSEKPEDKVEVTGDIATGDRDLFLSYFGLMLSEMNREEIIRYEGELFSLAVELAMGEKLLGMFNDSFSLDVNEFRKNLIQYQWETVGSSFKLTRTVLNLNW